MKLPTAALIVTSVSLIILLGIEVIFAQAEGEEVRVVWAETMTERLWSSHLDSDGTMFLLVHDGDFGGDYLYLDLHKYSRGGAREWGIRALSLGGEHRTEVTGASLDIASDLCGGVYVSEEHAVFQTVTEPHNLGTQLLSISSSGAIRWRRLFEGPARAEYEIGSAGITVGHDNLIYQVSYDSTDGVLLCYDSLGNLISSRGNSFWHNSQFLRTAPDSGVFLYGEYGLKYLSQGPATARSSDLRWVTDVATDSEGNSYCISGLTGALEFWVTKLDDSMQVVWRKTFPWPGERPLNISVEPSGSSTVYGTVGGYGWAAKYLPDGSLAWRQEWSLAEDWNGPEDFTVDVLGNAYAIDDSAAIRSYNPDGELRWEVSLGDYLSLAYIGMNLLNEPSSLLHIDAMGDLYCTAFIGYDIPGSTPPSYRTYLRRITQPKTLDLLDAKGDSLPNATFAIIRVHNDPPIYTEDTLGEFQTDLRGQFVLPFAGTVGYELSATELNPIADTLWFGDTIKIAKMIESQPAVRHQGVLGTSYSIHLDNATFDNAGRPIFDTVQFGSTQQIRLRHTEYRYNLLASVEWDAELAYLQGLEDEFRMMSNYLYDVSDGQCRLDSVIILDNSSSWLEADIRFHAENTYWPNADIMGIALAGQTPMNMPRKWFGEPDSSRAFSYLIHPLSLSVADNYRTMAHEFGHYGLGFDDEYLFANAAGGVVPTPAGCTPYPAGNFGFMSSQYDRPFSGEHASEMSSEYRYDNASCMNTRQWVSNGRSCWDDFEYWAERNRNGIFVPILRPSLTNRAERLTPTGLDYFPGPNNDLYSLDYDVGSLIQFPVIPAPPSGNNQSMHVHVFGSPIGGVRVSVLKNGPAGNAVEQGSTTDAGNIWALGVDPFVDDIFASGRLSVAYPGSLARGTEPTEIHRQWGFGHVQPAGLSSRTGTRASLSPMGDSLIMSLDTVQGYYPLVCHATLTGTGWDYTMFSERPFQQTPQYNITTESGQSADGTFGRSGQNYLASLPLFMTSTGSASIWAADDSAHVFFFETEFTEQGISSPFDLQKVIGPGGSVIARLDTNNLSLEKVVILSSPYPPILRGLDPGALQGGETHSISTYPDLGLVGENAITISYSDNDLKDGGGVTLGNESTLRLYRWDTISEEWSLVGGSVDVVRNLVTAPITQTGTYGAFTLYSNSSCCTGVRGNVNLEGMVDLTDLALLIGYLTITPRPALPCPLEANVNGTGMIDLTDLALLIGYLTITPRPALPSCP